MTISRKFTMWMIVNGLFVCALYIALWQAIDWLSVVVIAFVWFVLAANAIAYFRRNAKEYREPAPHWLGYLVDALVLYALLAHAWYLTTFAYLAGAVLLFLVYRHSEKQSTKEPKTGPIIEKETALPLSGDSSLTESAESEAPEEKLLSLSEKTNALDYLERAAMFVSETSENVRAWKWVVISLHGALYGFAVAVTKGTDDETVLNKKGKLLGFWEVLKMCQDPNRMSMLRHSKHLKLTKQQEESISRLTNLLRNRFEHFVPTFWSIEIHGLPQITIDVLEVIRFLALETGTFLYMKEEEEALVDKLVRETIEFIKGTELYAEMLRGQELYKKEEST